MLQTKSLFKKSANLKFWYVFSNIRKPTCKQYLSRFTSNSFNLKQRSCYKCGKESAPVHTCNPTPPIYTIGVARGAGRAPQSASILCLKKIFSSKKSQYVYVPCPPPQWKFLATPMIYTRSIQHCRVVNSCMSRLSQTRTEIATVVSDCTSWLA